jgi:Holliday junction DNA helicase RuvA
MIARLRGEVLERTASTLVIDVNGVGYLVHVSAQCPFRVGQRVDVHVHTHVRQDLLQLFGFVDPLEREVFNLLIDVPGIGPVKAMSILQTPVASLVQLVLRREAAQLSKLPGVGKKTAERLLVDLVDKFAALGPAAGASQLPTPAVDPGASSAVARDLFSALVNLGFREAAAEEAAGQALARLGEQAGLESLLRDALLHAQRPR